MNAPDYRKLDGVDVTNQDAEKLGRVAGLFIDDDLELPTWIAVRSGLFGSHYCLVPLAQTRFVDDRLFVPYSKDDLALAPHHDPDVELTVDEEQTLFEHYNVGFSDADAPGPHTGVDMEQTGLVGSLESGAHPVEPDEIDELSPAVPGVPGLPAVETTPRLRRYEPDRAG